MRRPPVLAINIFPDTIATKKQNYTETDTAPLTFLVFACFNIKNQSDRFDTKHLMFARFSPQPGPHDPIKFPFEPAVFPSGEHKPAGLNHGRFLTNGQCCAKMQQGFQSAHWNHH